MSLLKKFLMTISITGLFIDIASAQIDTVYSTDTLVNDYGIENLIDQTGVEEDSPLLDFLDQTKQRKTSYLQVRSRFIQRLQTPVGFRDGSYVGSSLKSYQRLKFAQGDHYSGGLLLKKDPGERNVHDFTTGNFMLSRFGIISKLILGDYFIEAGQGLALWRSYDVVKGAEVILPVERNASGLNPYLSSGESGYLRGVGTELKFGKLSPMVFYSQAFRAASLDSNGYIKSLYDLGYFRTESEIQKRNAVVEKLFGARCMYQFSQLNSVGITLYSIKLSKELYMGHEKEFSGRRFSVQSFDYKYSYTSLTVFGEVARGNDAVAGNSGLLIAPSDNIGIVVFGRYYPYRYFNLHGLGFGEQTSNEQGFYTGVHLKPIVWLTISSYYDQFRSIERTTIPFPTVGNDFLVHLEYTASSNCDLSLRFHRKISNIASDVIDANGFSVGLVDRQTKQNIRLNLDYKISPRIILRWRGEGVFLKSNILKRDENGFLIYQDIRFKPLSRLWLNIRVSYFNTDSYNSGIAEYERDLDGVLTQPILYGSGVRWYFMMKYEFGVLLRLSIKYSDYIRDDVKRIGTGLDELPGNHDNRLGVQLDLRL